MLDAKVAQPFVADIVIDQTDSERLAVTSSRDGKIVEIGDLPAVNARLTINGSNSLIVPGQFTLVRDWKPGTAFDERRIAELLARGTTTVLGVVDLSDRDAIEAIAKPQSLPFNWAFVGNADSLGAAEIRRGSRTHRHRGREWYCRRRQQGHRRRIVESHSSVRFAADQDRINCRKKLPVPTKMPRSKPGASQPL